jgi:hypothetical protein
MKTYISRCTIYYFSGKNAFFSITLSFELSQEKSQGISEKTTPTKSQSLQTNPTSWDGNTESTQTEQNHWAKHS